MQICPITPLTRPRKQTIIEVKNKIPLDHGDSCNCYYCCNAQPISYKYVQPEVPKSFAPIRYYWKSGIPMANDTTYRLSYWEGPTEAAAPICPQDGLSVGDGPISDSTTYKESYLGNWCFTPEPCITPCEKQWLGRGPLQNLTTQKHDFTWKYLKPIEAFKAQQNLYCPASRLSDDTTYKLSYFNSSCKTPTTSYAPIRKYSKANVPMDDCTTYRLSYWPNEPSSREEPPWNDKKEYTPPVEAMDACTTYKLSYWPHCESRRKPIINPETDNILNAGCCSDNNTSYRLSYFGCGGDRSDLIRNPDHFAFPSCPQPYDTTHRMSFVGNWCVKPEEAITPCDKQWLGKGPIQDLTTQKHDFTWKGVPQRPPLRPEDSLCFPCTPLDCCTTHTLSYLPNCNLTPTKNYAPIRTFNPANIPMDLDTTMQLSYQPNESPLEVEKPWSETPAYHPPVTRMEDNSTYSLRKKPWGTIVTPLGSLRRLAKLGYLIVMVVFLLRSRI